MRAALGNFSIFHNENLVGLLDGGQRWAIVMIVLPRVSSEMACWMRCSFSGSPLAVASSRMIMDASLRIARAMDAPLIALFEKLGLCGGINPV